MNRLKLVGLRFRSNFKKIDGTPFKGQILSIPDTSRVSNFLSARRYLRTQPQTIVENRDVIVINGLKFIVAEHGDGFYIEPIYKHFKLFEVNEVAIWYEALATVDPVTGQRGVVRDHNKGIVYLSSQPKTDIKDTLQVQHNTKTCICNADVKIDDRLGDWVVTKVDQVLGVTLLELKRG